jgi:hypothetical protein
MIKNQKFIKNIIPVEIESGFMRIPNEYRKLFPNKTSKIKVVLGDSRTKKELNYNSKHQRIYGLVNFFRKNKVEPRDILEFEKLDNKKFKLAIKKLQIEEKEKIEPTQEEAEEIINTGEISTSAKGRIVENRIKELITLYGQGILTVYEPASDIEGIDLVVLKRNIFQPLFIQVKSRFKLRGDIFQIGIKEKALQLHHAVFIIGAYFNPQKMDVDDYLVFIPSEIFKEKANIINRETEKALYVLNTSLNPDTHNRFSEFIIKKNNIVTKIFEKFKEIEKYLK